jgi:hypothetical protein
MGQGIFQGTSLGIDNPFVDGPAQTIGDAISQIVPGADSGDNPVAPYIPTQADLCNPASPYFIGEAACNAGKKIIPGGGGGGAVVPGTKQPLVATGGGTSWLSSPWLWVGVAALAAGGILYATTRKKRAPAMAQNKRGKGRGRGRKGGRKVVFHRRKR